MEEKKEEILRDLVIYLRKNILPFDFTIQMAKVLLPENDKALLNVTDNDRLLYIIYNKFYQKSPRFESIKLTKNNFSTYHPKTDTITIPSEFSFEVYVKLNETDFDISEKINDFPSAGIEIEEDIIREGDIFGNEYYVLVFTNVLGDHLEIKAIEIENKDKTRNTTKERDIPMNNEPLYIGRRHTGFDNPNISQENYIIERFQKNEYKIIHSQQSLNKLIRFFHDAYTLGKTDSQPIKTSSFRFQDSLYSLSLIYS